MQSLLDLTDKKLQEDFKGVINDIESGFTHEDEYIVEDLNNVLNQMEEEDQMKAKRFLTIQFKNRSFLELGKFIVDLYELETKQFNSNSDFQEQYKQYKLDNNYQGLINMMQYQKFCDENKISILIQQNIDTLSKLEKKFINVILINDNINSNEKLHQFELLKILLDLIYGGLKDDTEQKKNETVIGSMLIDQIYEFDFYLEQIQDINQEIFQEFIEYVQKLQMEIIQKQDQEANKFKQIDLQFLLELFLGDVKQCKKNLDNFLSGTLDIPITQLTCENIFNRIDIFILNEPNLEFCYFSVVWYLWTQYTCQSDFLKKLQEFKEKGRNQIDQNKRLIFYQRFVKSERIIKPEDKIFQYFIEKAIFLTFQLNQCDKYKGFKQNQIKLLTQYKEQYQDLKSYQEFIYLDDGKIKDTWIITQKCSWRQILMPDIQCQVLKKIILFMWTNHFEISSIKFLKLIFEVKNLPLDLCSGIIDSYFYQQSFFFKVSLLCIIGSMKDLNKIQINSLVKFSIKKKNFQDAEKLLRLNGLLENKERKLSDIKNFIKNEEKNGMKITEFYETEVLTNFMKEVIDLFMKKNKKKRKYCLVLLAKLFGEVQIVNNPELLCFKNIVSALEESEVLELFAETTSEQTPLFSLVQKQLTLLYKLYDKIGDQSVIQQVFYSLSFYLKHKFYNFNLIYELKKKQNVTNQLISLIIEAFYYDQIGQIDLLNKCCENIFNLDENIYRECFEQEKQFVLKNLTTKFLKIQKLSKIYPQNMEIIQQNQEDFSQFIPELTSQFTELMNQEKALAKNQINTQSVQCNLQIYEEIKNYERTYQERQGFAQIETFVSDLSSKPDELKKYQQQGSLIEFKFQELWKDMIVKQEQQQEKLFKDFQEKQFKSITSSFTEYTITSHHQQDYYQIIQNIFNKVNPNESLDEKKQFFNIYKKELTFQQFMALERNQKKIKNLRYTEIFDLPLSERMKKSTESDLIQIRCYYYYKVLWTLLDLQDLQNYFLKPFFDDLCKIILQYKQKYVKFNKLINFFAILNYFKIQYQQELLDKLIQQIKVPNFWSFSYKQQIEDIEQPYQKLISSFIFPRDPIFLQDENFILDFFSNYKSLHPPKYFCEKVFTEQEIIQKRNDFLKSYIIIAEKSLLQPQDFVIKYYQHYQYIGNQTYYHCLQNSFLSDFPTAFQKLMTEQEGWNNLYFSVYDIIKTEMIDNQKEMQMQNKLKQQKQQESEILSYEDSTNYSTSLIKIIMSKIEQQIIIYNKQFANFGVILNSYGERCIYYYSLFIIWRFVCSQKWRIFEKQKKQLENTQKIQFEKFKADIQENKAEQSKLKAQILVKDIYERFVEKFHQDQIVSASQFIQSKQLSSEECIRKLDQELLVGFDPEKKQEQRVYEYLTNQQKFIEDYSLAYSHNLELEVEERYSNILKKETCLFLQQIKANAEEIRLRITAEIKSKDYFAFQNNDQEQNDKLYEQKLYFIVVSCLFGEQVQDINQIDDQYKNLFMESNFQKISKKISVKFLQQTDQSIQLLKYFITEVSLLLDYKINNIELLKLNLSSLNIQNKIDEARLKIRGCQFTCPMCKRKCDEDNDHSKHLCKNGHYYRGMNGVLIKNKPSLFTCEEINDEEIIMTIETKTERLWKQIKEMYPEWQFKGLQTNEIEINRAKMKKIWNEGIGKLVCTKLNEVFQRKDIVFEIKADFEGQQQVIAEKAHYVFMLDDSGSMAGARWNNVRRGAISCMTDIGKNPNAKVSVIIFNNDSRIAINCQKVEISSQEPLLKFQSGGTDFGKAFSSLAELLKSKQNDQFEKIIILFYTDGEATYPTKEIQELTSVSKNIQQITTFIACTEEKKAPILSLIVTKLKEHYFQRAELKQSIQTEVLNVTWQEIVSNSFHNLKNC